MSAAVTPLRFDGKVVAITGGGSGIGEAAVQRFTAEGTAVAVPVSRNCAATTWVAHPGFPRERHRLAGRRALVDDASDRHGVATRIRAVLG